MKLSTVVLFIASFSLAGCATQNVSPAFSLDPQSTKGVVITSITYQGGYSGYAVLYRGLNDGPKGLLEAGQGVMLIPIPDKSDFGPTANGKLVVAEFSPGEYEIYDWRIHSGVATVRPSNEFSIRFKVEAGKAVYIGNFDFRQTSKMGLTVTGANLTFRGSMERDFTILKEKYPKLAEVKVAFATPSSTLITNLGGADSASFNIPVFTIR